MNNLQDDKMVVCRCEEITLGEIKQAIREGAHNVTDVKRITRAGMGLCQGRTCEKLIQAILVDQLRIDIEKTGANTYRPPVRPITFGLLGRKN